MKKRTKIIILTLMIVLLGVTGYLNIALNNSLKQTNTEAETSYFTAYRNDRETSHDQTMMYLDAIISDPSSTEADIANAKAQKNEIIAIMQQETAIEGLLRTQNFGECVVVINNGTCNVVLQSNVSDDDALLIYNYVLEQLTRPENALNISDENIYIIYAE